MDVDLSHHMTREVAELLAVLRAHLRYAEVRSARR
jgi:hypothetical protein